MGAPAPPPGFALDQDVPPPPAGFVPDAPTSATSVAPPPSTGEAIGRGALQGATFNFGDELSAAIDTGLSKVPGVRTLAQKANTAGGGSGGGLPLDNPDLTYAQRRDAYRATNAAAREAHPFAYGGGELVGGLATSVVPGAAVAKGAELGGAAGAGLRTLGTALGGGAGGGLAGTIARATSAGAAMGAGASEAEDLRGLGKDIAVGGALGGVTGGALHAAGSAIAKRAPKSFEESLNADIFKKAPPKIANPAVEFQKANPGEFREMAYSADFAPVQKLARAGKTEEAIQAAENYVEKAGAHRLDKYAEAAAGYRANPGAVVDRIEKEAARKVATGAPDEARALKQAADRVRSEFSTVDINAIPAGDTAHDVALAKLKAYLPDRATLTKAELQDAAIAASGGKRYGDVANDVHQAIESLPFRYDPDAAVSLVQLRKAATAAQNQTKATLGSIAETEHYRIVHGVDKAINAALDAHLDRAALTSPGAAAAVARIRHDNKLISMGLAAREGLEARARKEASGKARTLTDKLTEGLTQLTHVGSVGAAALTHNPLVLGAAALPTAVKVSAAGGRVATDQLARFIMAAKQGNGFARRALAALAATPAGAARLAAAAGGAR